MSFAKSLVFTLFGASILGVSTLTSAAPAPNPFATLAISKTTLLSGGLSDCLPDPNVSSYCTGGLATARAVFRSITNDLNSQNADLVSYFDANEAFVQMHPLGFAVNTYINRHFGLKYYAGENTFLRNSVGRRGSEYLFADDVRLLLANVETLATETWNPFVDRQAILYGEKLGLVIVDASSLPDSIDAAATILTTTAYLRSRVAVVVVFNNDFSQTSGMALLAKLSSNPPDVFVDLQAGADIPCYTVNRTQYCGANSGSGMINLVHIYLNGTLNGLGGAAVQSESITGFDVTSPIRDAQYYVDQAFLAAEASKAIAYDPVVGTSTVTMPSAGWTDTPATYPCFAGECPQGTVYGRAMMQYDTEADLSITNSGGLKGRGWTPGNIRQSHIWEMKPYIDTVVQLRVTGYKVWEIMNMSMAYFWGQTTYDSVADHFLQGDGFQVDFDSTRPRFTNRLLAVRIRNRKTGVWEPLERTKYYNIITDIYMSNFFPDISGILLKTYRGEAVTMPYGSGTIQSAYADMFTANQPYDNLYNNFMTTYTSATIGDRTPMDWYQTIDSCGAREYWDAAIVTCMPCAEGFMRSSDRTTCSPIPLVSSTTDVVPIIVPIVVVLVVVIVGIVAVLEYKRRKDTRNTSSAPRTGDNVTIVFTDIRSSTKLWGTIPASMAAALETHHRVIRECISRYGAYEVKTIGDSFMIACGSAEDAVLMAVSIQEELAAQQWPASISEVYACEGKSDEGDRLDLVSDLPDVKGDGDCGVLVRIGVNTGAAEATFDEVSKGYDYYGPAPNVASRIEAAAQGGQILTSRVTANILPPCDTYFVSHFTEAELQGVSGRTELLEVTPKSLAHRKYDVKNIKVKALQSVDGGTSSHANSIYGKDDGYAVVGDAAEVGSHSSQQSAGINAGAAALMRELERERYAIVMRESLNVALSLMDKKASEKLILSIGNSWRVKATGQLTATKETMSALTHEKSSRQSGPTASSHGQGQVLSIPKETLLLVSRRACHLLKRKLDGPGGIILNTIRENATGTIITGSVALSKRRQSDDLVDLP